jgi:C-terminal processing protease CtpA/Prc
MERASKKVAIRLITVATAGALCVVAFALFGMSRHGPPGPTQNDMTIDKATRSEVIESAIANLNQHYVFPEKAAALEKQLRAQMLRGEFDSISSAEKFAEILTEAVQRDTNDKHLEARYFEKAIAELPPGEDQSVEEKAEELARQTRLNFGFETVGRLKYNIGYIDLHAFGRPVHAADRIAAAMTLLADTRSLIIDLRKCSGGDPETVMLFASYLYDKSTHLNDVYWHDERRTEERWTANNVPGKKYGEARKIYVLTSEDTFSAGEDFAYALKNNGRATLIGETTGGGAHPGNPRRLSAHFMMFVPNGRAISPVTHTDWEGVGVAPDVKTSAKNALNVAQVAILKERLAAETNPDEKDGLQQRIAELE